MSHIDRWGSALIGLAVSTGAGCKLSSDERRSPVQQEGITVSVTDNMHGLTVQQDTLISGLGLSYAIQQAKTDAGVREKCFMIISTVVPGKYQSYWAEKSRGAVDCANIPSEVFGAGVKKE